MKLLKYVLLFIVTFLPLLAFFNINISAQGVFFPTWPVFTMGGEYGTRYYEEDDEEYTEYNIVKAYAKITEGFSCFILDINVPNVDGINILKKIREFYEIVPVIIISASVELDIIKQSYDFGCNDYLKKPFFIDELEIKIEKLCQIKNDKIYFDENSYFDFISATITINDQEIRLTKKEKLLMNLFLSKRNQVITYETIENYVWEGNFVTLESIRSLIRRLRKI
nr:response regulator transcription factor [Exilispira sp.]